MTRFFSVRFPFNCSQSGFLLCLREVDCNEEPEKKKRIQNMKESQLEREKKKNEHNADLWTCGHHKIHKFNSLLVQYVRLNAISTK